ncbi:DinB family protein [Virgibacillus sp. LDC-1]|uniref:DinB family protein n=1 Tax=Virgibacillus sp. LDC-1 TaxID=3039856 RepID=UPI0024DE9A71|nr:DinB family protein [Virgibacillus sp. LDC-1]
MDSQKKQIIEHYKQTMMWVRGLESLTEKEWRTQTSRGKWTIAEVIGHLTPWDEFIITKRIPYLFKTEMLPAGPNVEIMNQAAAKASRESRKEETIQTFLHVRERLLEEIMNLSNDQWKQTIRIGKNELTLFEYFNGLTEHDNHHFNQIKSALLV